ncbi:MAG: hypothetical protein ABW321_11515, partial [Polyangiales bacterium]
MLALITACSHARQANPTSPTQVASAHERSQPGSSATAAMPTEARSDRPATGPLLPRNPQTQGEPVTAFMAEHFEISTWARNAVVEGSIEKVRIPLLALANYDYRTVVPGGWMQGVLQLQAAARLTADANSLEAAAVGVA